MKKVFFYATMLVAMFLASCEVPEGNDLLNRVEDLESRVEALEKLCAENNTNISSLKTLVDVINSKEMIEAVIPIASGDKILGYTITFSKRDAIIIYSAMDANGTLPVVGVKAESGVYYWTLNGEWLLDDGGKKIAVSGKDGITPQLKIENGFWWVSYDGKATWEKLGEATGENSGNNSAGGECMIKEITDEGSSVRFTLADDTVITIAKDPNGPDTNAVFTITYKANGGEGEDVVSNVKYGRIHIIGYTGTMSEEGDEVEFTKEGLVLLSWNTKPDGTGETYKRYEYIVAQKNITLYAQWKKTFNLTLFYGNNCNIQVTDGYFDYDYSDNNKKKGEAQAGEITLEAYSYDDGGEFVEWSDGVTDNPRTVTINSDTTFTAIFIDTRLTLTTYPNRDSYGAGYVNVNGNSRYDGVYKVKGGEVVIEAEANSGYEFVKWSDGNTDNPRTIMITSDTTFTAIFTEEILEVPATCTDYVDLGLPSGLKWATCNVGASSPEEYGCYFAWGEVTTKRSFTE
ncbi:MAG: InlB B-repeat-containing protein, partial [Paludibacteraceae bacterium]|nr:InlB B-repeat-containing protein [Paludibacteraceae bacterium]